MRTLATLQRIKALAPIEGADAILKATVLGWQLVVKKNEFQIGDLVIYCEIDSLMPDRPEFEFLKPRAMRIRTVRLRGQVSQGICFPLTLLPAGAPRTEGSDVTDILGITKYEPPMPASLSGLAKGLFPSFIPKTDETRVQVLQELLEKYAGTTCYVSEKLDGSSVTYFLRHGEFGVCSRNLELLETSENSLWNVARVLAIEEKLRALNRNLALQGEIIGEGIQGNIAAPDEEPKSYVTFYVQVPQIEAALDKIAKLGGKVLVPATDVPGMGQFAWFADLDGNAIGLWKSA